jgi:hypothetical protein
MTFDAQTARALSRRIHSVQDCLFVMKQHVVQAAQAGEYEVGVGLSESLPVVAGQSVNSAAFVIDFLARSGREAWSEAVAQAVHAGYGVRPLWGRTAGGPRRSKASRCRGARPSTRIRAPFRLRP